MPVEKGLPVTSKLMPALQGMGLKDAVYLCENMGLKVSVKGTGKVMAQSVPGGSKISKGQQVKIELN